MNVKRSHKKSMSFHHIVTPWIWKQLHPAAVFWPVKKKKGIWFPAFITRNLQQSGQSAPEIKQKTTNMAEKVNNLQILIEIHKISQWKMMVFWHNTTTLQRALAVQYPGRNKAIFLLTAYVVVFEDKPPSFLVDMRPDNNRRLLFVVCYKEELSLSKGRRSVWGMALWVILLEIFFSHSKSIDVKP